jgi:tetratricopeptide (TPR) repeat protein
LISWSIGGQEDAYQSFDKGGRKHRVGQGIDKNGIFALRLVATSLASSRYRVDVKSEGIDGAVPVRVEFDLPLDDARRERFRWYFEEYLQYPLDPAPAVAASIVGQLKEFGGLLFRNIFDQTKEGRRLWTALEGRIGDARFELHAAGDQSAALPWELMQDPKTGLRPAIAARAFVRCTDEKSTGDTTRAGTVRVLLVISRPYGAQDVPFRVVAARLLDSLNERFEITALRPPTYERFQQTLGDAAAAGRPFHIVHFDGHGIFADLNAAGNKRGYISFEDEAGRYVPGDRIGALLGRMGTPILVLNACQSARAEAKTTPAGELADDTARAYLSFAHEASAAGLAGVVAMSYAIFADTAAEFVAALYVSLAAGASLGQAVTQARRRLAANVNRSLWFESRAIEDWSVPVVYESRAFQYAMSEANDGSARTAAAASRVPEHPNPGFVGRDASLLVLDRSFEKSRTVLLHGYAGSGKTVTTAEFARWYERTGGVPPMHAVYTSFEHYLPLAGVLDQLADRFARAIGVDWLSLQDVQARRAAALRLLQSRPVLWIWDNVEPVNGFPPGAASLWTVEEQTELLEFLRDAGGTQARILLASRTDERRWLGALPERVALPPLDLLERFQLATAVAREAHAALGPASDWMPLLEFSGGNPMALTILIRQALRMGLSRGEEIAAFIERLRKGEAEFTDEKSELRSASLAASLQYGFEDAFDEKERRRLALLQLFQGFVDAETLDLVCTAAGEPTAEGVKETGALLARAAAIGQLTSIMEAYYTIHPALPWFFRRMMRKYFGGKEEELARAFIRAEAHVGTGVEGHYEMESRGIVAHLQYEEANLRHALRQALELQMWDEAAELVSPIAALYRHLGRNIELTRLVGQIAALLIDPETHRAQAGVSEKAWLAALWFKAELDRDAGRLESAEAMQTMLVGYAWNAANPLVDRAAVEAAAATSESAHSKRQPEILRVRRNMDKKETGKVTSLSARLNALGQTQRLRGLAECTGTYKLAWALSAGIGDWRTAAACCDNLMLAYTGIVDTKDLDKSMYWAKKSLELATKVGPHWWSRAHAGVGRVWRHRFLQTLGTGERRMDYLSQAERDLLKAEKWLLNISTLADKTLVHSELGNVYTYLGQPQAALDHFQKALRFDEESGKFREAADLRFNISLMLGNADEFDAAIQYAEAALAGYEGLNLGDLLQAQQIPLLLIYLRARIRPPTR